MKTRNILLLAGVAVFLTACIPSLNPFYTEKDVIFDAGLLGEWTGQESNDPETWKFEAEGDRAYKLTVTESGKTGQFEARLFRIKSGRFLDLVPTDCDFATDQAELVAASMFPGHLLVRVSQTQPTLKVGFFDFDWLAKHLEKNPKALSHRKEGKGIVLTASSRELQRFVQHHLGAGQLFDKTKEMVRKPAGVAATPTK